VIESVAERIGVYDLGFDKSVEMAVDGKTFAICLQRSSRETIPATVVFVRRPVVNRDGSDISFGDFNCQPDFIRWLEKSCRARKETRLGGAGAQNARVGH